MYQRWLLQPSQPKVHNVSCICRFHPSNLT
jgi:hypothetical protein